jgi:hypothetical protein
MFSTDVLHSNCTASCVIPPGSTVPDAVNLFIVM